MSHLIRYLYWQANLIAGDFGWVATLLLNMWVRLFFRRVRLCHSDIVDLLEYKCDTQCLHAMFAQSITNYMYSCMLPLEFNSYSLFLASHSLYLSLFLSLSVFRASFSLTLSLSLPRSIVLFHCFHFSF